MSDAVAQTMMPAWAWFASLLVVIPLVLCGTTHLVLRRLMPAPAGR
ncbi:hypothetical protein [Methylobacterium sp. Leaf93]|nr:hypothetical protein [Methylobacterium sp. Leaf93]